MLVVKRTILDYTSIRIFRENCNVSTELIH